MARKESGANLHVPKRLLERGRSDTQKSRIGHDKNGDMLKSPKMTAGFAGGECYPGNNDYYSAGFRNKSPKVDGNIRLAKAFAERKLNDGYYEGPYGSITYRPDVFNKKGAARKESDSHPVVRSNQDSRGFSQE